MEFKMPGYLERIFPGFSYLKVSSVTKNLHLSYLFCENFIPDIYKTFSSQYSLSECMPL